MEYNYNDDQKVGGGIIAIAILTFIANFFGIIGNLVIIAMPDKIRSVYEGNSLISSEQVDELVNMPSAVISLILSILLVVSLILLLQKKTIGVYGYFVIELVSIVVSIIFNGFSLLSLIMSLIFPIIMLCLVKGKTEVFGIGSAK